MSFIKTIGGLSSKGSWISGYNGYIQILTAKMFIFESGTGTTLPLRWCQCVAESHEYVINRESDFYSRADPEAVLTVGRADPLRFLFNQSLQLQWFPVNLPLCLPPQPVAPFIAFVMASSIVLAHLIFLILYSCVASAATADEWRTRSIYQCVSFFLA